MEKEMVLDLPPSINIMKLDQMLKATVFRYWTIGNADCNLCKNINICEHAL